MTDKLKEDLKKVWISVENKLPPKDGTRILIFINQPHIAEWGSWTDSCCNWEERDCWCIYDAEDAHYSCLVNDDEITHWMPLPNPPKTERGARG